MKVALFTRFMLLLPPEAVRDCSAPGQDATESVTFWAPRIARPAGVSASALAAELSEYGAWSAEELTDDAENWRRIVWCAACNVREEEAQGGNCDAN